MVKKFEREYLDITQHQIEALKLEYNLADAHTHQSQSTSQRKIVESLPKLWYQAEKMRQSDLDQKFIEIFYKAQKQEYALKNKTNMLVYAASIGMVMTANYLLKHKLTVSLVQPAFDNIADIMKNMDLKPKPFDENLLHDPSKIYENLKKNIKTDALFFVDPNNPTGFSLFSFGKKGWKEVIRYCKDFKKLLIVDFCFGSFLLGAKGSELFDVYQMLDNSDIR